MPIHRLEISAELLRVDLSNQLWKHNVFVPHSYSTLVNLLDRLFLLLLNCSQIVKFRWVRLPQCMDIALLSWFRFLPCSQITRALLHVLVEFVFKLCSISFEPRIFMLEIDLKLSHFSSDLRNIVDQVSVLLISLFYLSLCFINLSLDFVVQVGLVLIFVSKSFILWDQFNVGLANLLLFYDFGMNFLERILKEVVHLRVVDAFGLVHLVSLFFCKHAFCFYIPDYSYNNYTRVTWHQSYAKLLIKFARRTDSLKSIESVYAHFTEDEMIFPTLLQWVDVSMNLAASFWPKSLSIN